MADTTPPTAAKKAPAFAPIVLRSITTPTLRLQILAGSSEDVPGTRRQRIKKAIYVEFAGFLGAVDQRTMRKCGFDTREEMIDRLRSHQAYMDSFVLHGEDANEEEEAKVSSSMRGDEGANKQAKAVSGRKKKI